jgi:hypothetical protein
MIFSELIFLVRWNVADSPVWGLNPNLSLGKNGSRWRLHLGNCLRNVVGLSPGVLPGFRPGIVAVKTLYSRGGSSTPTSAHHLIHRHPVDVMDDLFALLVS